MITVTYFLLSISTTVVGVKDFETSEFELTILNCSTQSFARSKKTLRSPFILFVFVFDHLDISRNRLNRPI